MLPTEHVKINGTNKELESAMLMEMRKHNLPSEHLERILNLAASFIEVRYLIS